MNDIVIKTNFVELTLAEMLTFGVGAILFILIVFLIMSWRRSAYHARAARQAIRQNHEINQQVQQLLASQSELSGRLQAMSEMTGAQSAELARNLTERMDNSSLRVNHLVQETREKTSEKLTKLQERLAVIDAAQKTMTDISGEIVSLQSIFANKQTRGAFGQGRMEMIIQDGLPHGGYEFQASLPNRSRPDCLIFMPNQAPSLVIDAKFPLEAWSRLQDADGENDLKLAKQQLRQDFMTHIKDISTKYLIPGVTHDMALMFVPSEIYICRYSRSFRRYHSAGPEGAYHSCLALTSDALNSGGAGINA